MEPHLLWDRRAPLHCTEWAPVPGEVTGSANIGDGAVESRLPAEPGGGGGGGGGVRGLVLAELPHCSPQSTQEKENPDKNWGSHEA